VFNVAAEGNPLLTQFDIYASAGGAMRAVVRTFTVTVSDGTLNLAFTNVVNWALVNAIEVLPATPPAPTTVRLNAGGAAVTTGGLSFAADSYATGSSAVATNAIADFAGTTSDVLYRDFRRASVNGGSFGYSIPVAKGTYTVKLHFAETYFGVATAGGAGSRVFNVTAEGSAWLTHYDIFAEAGGKRAVVKTRNVTVSDGILHLNFQSVVEKALVAAIEVVPATVYAREGSQEQPGEVQTFSAYPNPALDHVTLAFTVNQTQPVRLGVYDVQGNLIGQLFEGEAQAGRVYRFRWNAMTQAAGVYVGRLVAGQEVRNQKLVLCR
jgi:hypothetical protein